MFDIGGVKSTVSYRNLDASTWGAPGENGIPWYGNPHKFGFVQSFSDVSADHEIKSGWTQGGNNFIFDERYDIEYDFLDSRDMLWGTNMNGNNFYIDFNINYNFK